MRFKPSDQDRAVLILRSIFIFKKLIVVLKWLHPNDRSSTTSQQCVKKAGEDSQVLGLKLCL